MATTPKRKAEIFPSLRRFFGKAVTLLRGRTSKEALARKAGMDPKTLGRLENGEVILREDYVEGLLRSLEITLPDFLRKAADCCEDEEREGGPSVREMPTDDLFSRLRKVSGDIARLQVESRDLDLEIQRRQIK